MNEAVTEHVRDDQTRLCQLPVIGKRKLDQIVRAGHFPPRLWSFPCRVGKARRASLARQLTSKPSILMFTSLLSFSHWPDKGFKWASHGAAIAWTFLLAVSYITQAAKVRAGWRLVFLVSFGWAAGIALHASAWIDQRLGVVVIFFHSSHPAIKGKTT